MMKFKLRIGDQEEEIEASLHGHTLHVRRNGQVVEARLVHQDGPHLTLEYDEPGENGLARRRQLKTAVHLSGDKRQLWVDGRTLTYERVREKAAGGSSAADASLSATIPAVVSQILVQVGDTIQTGDKLILLESMKMVIPIVAPHDGTVKKINCTAGQAVQPGNPLIELE
jgi:biotin carboxyl carrier protein